MNVSKPIRHHYVPQFLMKHWFHNGNPTCHNTEEDTTFNPASPQKLGLEKNLYTFNGFEIESQFITPYIDNPLHKSVEELVNKKWNELTPIFQENFLKFLLLLDARQPQSLKSMAKAYNSTPDKFSLINFDNNIDTLIESFLKDKMYSLSLKPIIKNFLNDEMSSFILIAIHELELISFEKTHDSEGFKQTLEFFQIYLKELEKNGKLFPSFLSCLLNYDVVCREIISDTDVFVMSTSPVRRIGSYDKQFLVVLNISPRKSILFSNVQDMIDKITKCSKEHVIENIMALNIGKISETVPMPKIIIYP